jgi:hypothetical protein
MPQDTATSAPRVNPSFFAAEDENAEQRWQKLPAAALRNLAEFSLLQSGED